MASVRSPQQKPRRQFPDVPAPRTPQEEPRHLRLDRSQETFRSRASRFSRQVALALLLAAPLLFLAITAHDRGFVSPSLQFVVNRGHLATGGPGLSHLQYVYPPLPVLLSIILPGDQLSLAICACLFSGLMASVLVRRIGLLRAMLLGMPLIAVPQMWFFNSELLPPVVALSFLAVALFGFIQFASYGETYGGFIAGLALAASYAADPGAILYALVMCLFVPVLGADRYHGDPQGPIGAAAVIAFPVLAMAACWSFLIWKFSGTWPGNLDYAPSAHVLQFPDGVLGGLGHALASAFADLARSTLYIATAVVLAVHRRTILLGVGLLLPALALALALWIGYAYSAINAYYMFVLLAIAVIANHRLMDRSHYATVLVIAAAVQVIIGIELLPPTTGFTVWQHIMFQ
jgi:hypothetical protein